MPLYAFEDADVVIEDPASCWIAPSAVLIGRVRLARNTSIWWGAVLRGDNEPIEIGEGSNIQENSVLHTDPGAPLRVGAGVTVGHLAMLHGCTVGDHALIGIRATVLNHAVIGAETLVGAHALVTERKEYPPGQLLTGAPAKPMRALSEEERQHFRLSSAHYVDKARRMRAGLRPSAAQV